MDKKQGYTQIAENALDIVNGGAKTIVNVDDTKPTEGGLKLMIDGELVTLYNDGDDGFYCFINGKEYKFSNAEIAEMLHEQLQ